MTETSTPSCAIIVMSCDHYDDVWKPFFHHFFLHWPKRCYPVYLVSNWKKYHDDRIVTLCAESRDDWSSALKWALDKVDAEVVLLFVDDLLVQKPVDTELVTAALHLFRKPTTNYVRLVGRPKPSKGPYNADVIFGEIAAGEVYRTATVGSMWRKATLSALLKQGETAWAFESLGSLRSDDYGGFFSSWGDIFQLDNVIVKGRWKRRSYLRLAKSGIMAEASKRPVMTYWQQMTDDMAIVRNRALYFLPRSRRRWIRSLFRPDVTKPGTKLGKGEGKI